MEEKKREQKGSQSSSMKDDYSYQKVTNNLLSIQMENKSASIMTLALMLVHKQELLQNISQKLNKLIKSHSDQYVKIQLNEIIGDISKESDNNRDWSYFEAHLEHNDQGFIMNKIPLLNKLKSTLILGFHELAVLFSLYKIILSNFSE